VASCQVELNTRSLTDVIKETCGFAHPKKSDEERGGGRVAVYRSIAAWTQVG